MSPPALKPLQVATGFTATPQDMEVFRRGDFEEIFEERRNDRLPSSLWSITTFVSSLFLFHFRGQWAAGTQANPTNDGGGDEGQARGAKAGSRRCDRGFRPADGRTPRAVARCSPRLCSPPRGCGLGHAELGSRRPSPTGSGSRQDWRAAHRDASRKLTFAEVIMSEAIRLPELS